MNPDPLVMRFFVGVMQREAGDRELDGWQAGFDARGWSDVPVAAQPGGVAVRSGGVSPVAQRPMIISCHDIPPWSEGEGLTYR